MSRADKFFHFQLVGFMGLREAKALNHDAKDYRREGDDLLARDPDFGGIWVLGLGSRDSGFGA